MAGQTAIHSAAATSAAQKRLFVVTEGCKARPKSGLFLCPQFLVNSGANVAAQVVLAAGGGYCDIQLQVHKSGFGNMQVVCAWYDKYQYALP
jgi:hypothetical protein